ncbi:ribonuclease H-like domain-containing protein [Tanacetum coccineum]|uniref:Ribonuclease H-like domain-containing protein n=1 Tax=Tanacetum coccineum TaxID=301880 RepID=A0ABQ4XJV4_9ASTR
MRLRFLIGLPSGAFSISPLPSCISYVFSRSCLLGMPREPHLSALKRFTRQFTLSRSSAEAEYRGVANAVAETCWLRNLLRELHTPLATATLVYCDNVSAISSL